MNALQRDALLAAAYEMCEMLRKWALVGTPLLARDDGPDSVFRAQYATLRKTLEHLDVTDPRAFYEMVISGSTPEQAMNALRRPQS